MLHQVKIVYHQVISNKFFLRLKTNFYRIGTPHRQVTASPMQLIQQSMRIYLRSYLQTYEQLKKCEQDIKDIIEKEFSGQLDLVDDQKPFVNTLWLSNCTKAYSSWIHRADKFLKDLIDLNDSFRKVSQKMNPLVSILKIILGSFIKYI